MSSLITVMHSRAINCKARRALCGLEIGEYRDQYRIGFVLERESFNVLRRWANRAVRIVQTGIVIAAIHGCLAGYAMVLYITALAFFNLRRYFGDECGICHGVTCHGSDPFKVSRC